MTNTDELRWFWFHGILRRSVTLHYIILMRKFSFVPCVLNSSREASSEAKTKQRANSCMFVSDARTLVLKTGYWQGKCTNLSQWTRVCVSLRSTFGFTRPGQSQAYENSSRNYFIHTIELCLNDALNECLCFTSISRVSKTVKDYQCCMFL